MRGMIIFSYRCVNKAKKRLEVHKTDPCKLWWENIIQPGKRLRGSRGFAVVLIVVFLPGRSSLPLNCQTSSG